MSTRSLIVLPDDTGKQIIDAIKKAKKSIRVKMFIFSDPDLINAIIEAKKRGVKIDIMLNPARRNGVEENDQVRKLLEEVGVEVRDSNPSFGITHEKSMVVDDELAIIHSLNWDTKNLNLSRDYAIITTHKHEVKEIISCFEADWNRIVFVPGTDAKLIWCTGNGRLRIAELIDKAKYTLFVQNERYQDEVIVEHLVRAAIRGVKVHIMAKSPHSLKKQKLVEGVGGLRILEDVGVKIHKLKKLKLHGKMILADGERAIIGSINLAPGSFDDRRELAIEIHDEAIIKRLQEVANHDWENSKPLDLSDEGLFNDLENHNLGSSESLALEVDDKAVKHHKKH
ncbi:phospholipase D-like domain-containing protein [Flavobacterium sp. N3904]|uniref:phospholipase D-like domain-containing protein n=1 Tax=Flavobacterium sp. N3904 TaxID=2986835 RepID=UPI002224023E|nr:phospholipase D-like domain-containing protein [Flavobacterium sp. N3904]